MEQPANAYKFRIGHVLVTVLLDTYLQGSLDIVTGIDLGLAEELHARSHKVVPPQITINVFLIDDGHKRILVDTGFGAFTPNGGPRLLASLHSIGLDSADIGVILVTHVHPDHVGGLMSEHGEPVFPHAHVLIPSAELEYWGGRAPQGISDNQREKFAQAHQILALYDNQITPIVDTDVLPGIKRVSLPGHTPGHSGYRLISDGQSLLFWADLVHLPQIQLTQPEATVMFDVEPEKAIDTRMALFEKLSSSGEMVAGAHLDFPGLGYIEKTEANYGFLPHVWSPSF